MRIFRVDWYLFICFNDQVIHVAHAIANDSKNKICHFNLSCPNAREPSASCKIIMLELDIKSRLKRFSLKQIVVNEKIKTTTWTSRSTCINHAKMCPLFASPPPPPSVVYFTFWYILISSTVHHSLKLVVLKFLLVMCRSWNLKTLFFFGSN